MPEFELSQTAQHCTNLVLIWLGFGIAAGLCARLLVPGREPVGPVGTLVLGLLGSVLGPLVLTWLVAIRNFNPISPIGLLAAIAGSVLVLMGYRLVLTYRPGEFDEDEVEETT